MKRNKLRENVKNVIMEIINKENVKKIDKNIEIFIKKISDTDLLRKDLMFKYDQGAIYMYHALSIMNLYKFMKISLKKQEIGYFKESKKVLLNEVYKIEYNGIEFVLFLSYEFISFEIKSKGFSIEPYVFAANKLSIDLVNEYKIIWNKKYNFDIEEDEYIKKITDFNIEVMPCLDTRACEISIFEKGKKLSTSLSYKFEEVFKYVLDILIDEKFINTNRSLKYTYRKKGIYLEDVEVDSNFVYNDLIIGKLRRNDTLYKYEATFVIEGISRYVKLVICLTKDEYQKVNKLQKYISPEKKLSKVDRNSSVYLGNELSIFRINYCNGENNANMYINSKKTNNQKRIYIEDVLSNIITIDPVLINISDKGLPFPKVILYKNILEVDNDDEDLKRLSIYDIEYEDIIYVKNQLCFLKKYIIIIDNLVYKVELLSELEQGILSNDYVEINLPVILSKKIEVRYQNLNNTDLKLDDIIFSNHLHNDISFNNIYKTISFVNLDHVKNDILLEYHNYFNEISIYTIGNKNALKSCIENTLKFDKKINMYDFIDNTSKEFVIFLRGKTTLEFSDCEAIDYDKVDLFVDEFLIGIKIITEKKTTLEFNMKEKWGKSRKCLLSIDVNTKDIDAYQTLYNILYNKDNIKIITKELNTNDELTRMYIDRVFKKYNK